MALRPAEVSYSFPSAPSSEVDASPSPRRVDLGERPAPIIPIERKVLQ